MSSLTPSYIDELVVFLQTIPLFTKLESDELRLLIEQKDDKGNPRYLSRETKPPGTELFRQSDDDKQLRIIYQGRVRLTYIDPDGAPSTVAIVEAGKAMGESALFFGEPHDVTALTLTEVTSLIFKRDSFLTLRAEYPRLWGHLKPNDRIARRLAMPQFSWLGKDELVIIYTREHWWGLMRRMFFPLIALLGVIAFTVFVQQTLPHLIGLAVFIGVVVLGGIVGYFVMDWRNDYWVVTNKRIVHVDELVMVRKRRQETPLPSITQVQFERHGMAAAILDFGDLDVETFTGTIGMRDLPSPMFVKQEVLGEVEKLQARARAAGRKGIRDDLQKRIVLKETPPPPKPSAEPAPPPRPPLRMGIFRYFFPQMKTVEGDTIVWRKYWVELWRRGLWSTLALLFGLFAFLNWFTVSPPFGVLLEDGAWWIWPIILGGLAAWWWWIFEDWRNDEYVLTANRVIEITRTPFALNETRRESQLSDFQSTEVKVIGPWQKMFRYGTLIIKLPGAAVEFKDISNPSDAQVEIQKRLNAYKAKQAAIEAQSRRSEMTDWFAAYDEIRQRDRVKDTAPAPASTPPAGGEKKDGNT